MANLLVHKTFTNCISSLISQHTATHKILCVLQSLVRPAAFSFGRTVCSTTYCFVSNGHVANSAHCLRIVLEELCGPSVG